MEHLLWIFTELQLNAYHTDAHDESDPDKVCLDLYKYIIYIHHTHPFWVFPLAPKPKEISVEECGEIEYKMCTSEILV